MSRVSDRDKPSGPDGPATISGGRTGGGTKPDDRRIAREARECERETTTSSTGLGSSDCDEVQEAMEESEELEEDEAIGRLSIDTIWESQSAVS